LNFSLRQLVVSFFIFFDVARPGLFFILCANAQLMISPFMGEYLFFEWPKKMYQKKSHPTVLAYGVSVRFSLERALRNSLSLRQSSRYSALTFQCSTAQKGLQSKSGRWLQRLKYKHLKQSARHTGVGRYPELLTCLIK